MTESNGHNDQIKSLQERNIVLEAQHQKRDDFTNMIVHDLKGPLGEIISNIDILTYCKTLTEYEKDVLDTAIQGCDTLFSMIMTLLDIGKMEQGKLDLHVTGFSLYSLIQKKIKGASVLLNQKELKIECLIDEDFADISGDEGIIERVIANLLYNAISYSNDKGTIYIKAISDDTGVTVSVSDEGSGIPISFQSEIFEKFAQVAAGGSRRKGSTGLGLTFCKLAVEAHGGTIWVESEEGRGSEFFFTIPLA